MSSGSESIESTFDSDSSTSEAQERVEGRAALIDFSKFLIRSKKDLGAWRPGDLVLGLYYLKAAHMANQEVYPKTKPDLDFLEEAEHYAYFAEAAYKNDKDAVMVCTGLPRKCIVKHETKSTLGAPGHLLLVDHARAEVVLSIRGTKKMSDVLTDTASAAVDFQDGRGHEGFKEAAQWIVRNVLPKIRKQLSKHPTYSFTVTGHSLGAATAAMFTMLIHEDYPEAKAFVFGLPPCVSMDLALGCRDYITGVILDYDIIPRLSANAVEDLREELYYYPWWKLAKKDFGKPFVKGKEFTLDVIEQVGKSKPQEVPLVLGKIGLSLGAKAFGAAAGAVKSISSDGKGKKKKKKGKSKSKKGKDAESNKAKSKGKSKGKAKAKAPPPDPDSPIPTTFKRKTKITPLFPPGRLVHIYRIRDATRDVKFMCMDEVGPERFSRIVLCNSMLLDHRMSIPGGKGYIEAIQMASGKLAISSSESTSQSGTS